MLKTFAELEAELGLPADAVKLIAMTKTPGKEFRVGARRFLLMSPTHAQEIVRSQVAKHDAAKAESDTAKALFELVRDEVRVLGVQPCMYGPDGVVHPLSNLEWELYCVAKLRGQATYAAAGTAAKHVLSMMTQEHRASFVLEPEEIEPILFRDAPRKPCWARIQVEDRPLQEPPEAFAEFLGRIKTPSQAESLVRWIGSVLDTKSDRSEFLYLRGDGNDGKSALIGVLNRVLSPASQVISTDTLKNDHGSTALEGKRLVIFNEENSATFAKSAVLKRITGDDAHLINPKNAALRTALFQCKVIYVSNFEPSIHGLQADKRRIAYVEVNPYTGIDTSFKDRLLEQAPDMLRYCWTLYRGWRAANPRGGRLGDPAALEPLAQESTVSEAEDMFNALFSVSQDPADYLTAIEVKRIIADHCRGDYQLQVAVKKTIHAKVGRAVVQRIPGRKETLRCYLKLRRPTLSAD